MKSSNDSTPVELDVTLLKEKSPQGIPDVSSHVQLAARMSDSQQKMDGSNNNKEDGSQNKNDASNLQSQDGELHSSQKESLINIGGGQRGESNKNDDSNKHQTISVQANNINESS